MRTFRYLGSIRYALRAHAVPASLLAVAALSGCGSKSSANDGTATGGTGAGTANTTTSTGVSGGDASTATTGTSGSDGEGGAAGSSSTTSTGASSTASSGASTGVATTASSTGTSGASASTGRTTGISTGTSGTIGSTSTTGTTADAATCAPPDAGPLVGWASVAANGISTTNGGEGGKVFTVTTGPELNSYIAGTAATIIQVAGAITGNFNIGSNKTIVGCGGSIQGHIGISGSSNVIIRNLKIVGNNCTDITAGMGCSTGEDAVSIGNNAHHIWIDHDDISDGSDGNLDINHAADYITISWTKFWYSTKRVDTGPNAANGGHRFSDLISSADTDTGDMGHLKTTFHHDWWADNVYERMPRVRFGQIHLFNNLYTPVGDSYCIGVGVSADIRAENNVFQSVNKPIDTTSYSDANSHMQSIGNLYTNSPPGADLNVPSFDPSTFYTYTLDATADLPAAIMAGIGPR